MTQFKIKNGGSWVTPSAVYIKSGGAWSPVIDAVTNPSISFVKTIVGSSLASGTTVTFTGHAVGDLLVACGGTQAATGPTIASGTGWTVVKSANTSYPRSMSVAVKFATSTSNDTVGFTGTGTSASIYSGGIVFRGARSVGALNTYTSTTPVSTVHWSGVTPFRTDSTSAFVVMAYLAGPNGFTGTPAGWSRSDGILYKVGASSCAAGSATVAGGMIEAVVTMEILD